MKKIILKMVPKPIVKFVANVRGYYYREHSINNVFGKNTDKPVYIIRRRPTDSGFFSNFFYVLGHIVYADKKGYLPVVDMENYKTLYNERGLFNNTKNSWEYYFEQPSKVTLKEAYNCKKTILSKNEYLSQYVPLYTSDTKRYITEDMVNQLYQYVEKYIRVKPDIEKMVLEFIEENKLQNGNVLGVHYRGTDMNIYPGHPRPLSREEYLLVVDNYIKEKNINKVVLCTDEAEMIELAKSKLSTEIIFTNSFRSETGTVGIHVTSDDRKHHKYLMGREVLIDTLILSKCDYLLCGHSNVSYAAMVFNKNQYKGFRIVCEEIS